ncbi:hypothetical protein PCE1_000420 [Barthelona sp. PCE]
MATMSFTTKLQAYVPRRRVSHTKELSIPKRHSGAVYTKERVQKRLEESSKFSLGTIFDVKSFSTQYSPNSPKSRHPLAHIGFSGVPTLKNRPPTPVFMDVSSREMTPKNSKLDMSPSTSLKQLNPNYMAFTTPEPWSDASSASIEELSTDEEFESYKTEDMVLTTPRTCNSLYFFKEMSDSLKNILIEEL